MAKSRFPIISVHGSYFGVNFGDILLIRLYSKWICEVYGGKVLINYPIANQETIKANNYTSNGSGLTGLINLCRSKALIYVGGGYFGEPPTNVTRWSIKHIREHIVVGIIAILFRIPIAIIGLEYGPLSNKLYRFAVLFVTKHAKTVVVRNEESKSFLQENGFDKAIVCPDTVLALSEYVKPRQSANGNPLILLHIKYIYRNLGVLDMLLEQICRLKDYRTLLISDNRYSYFDHPQFQIVLERLKKKGIDYELVRYSGVDNLIDVINQSTFVVTTKLHVGITAAAFGKKVFSVYNHPKTKRFHRQIGNIYCIPLSGDGNNYQELFESFFESSTFCLSEELKQRALQNRMHLVSFLKSTKK